MFASNYVIKEDDWSCMNSTQRHWSLFIPVIFILSQEFAYSLLYFEVEAFNCTAFLCDIE